jgi:hypothetical protein
VFAPLNREGNGVMSAYQLNSLGISNSCTFGMNSSRKVLKSSPWAHHIFPQENKLLSNFAQVAQGEIHCTTITH